jgi:hypothetical protein
MKTLETAHESLKTLQGILKFGDVGTVAGDVETLTRFMVDALNDGREEDIATLARLAAALRSK